MALQCDFFSYSSVVIENCLCRSLGKSLLHDTFDARNCPLSHIPKRAEFLGHDFQHEEGENVDEEVHCDTYI